MAKYGERIESGMPLVVASEGWQTGAMAEPPSEFYEGMHADQLAQVRAHDAEERQQQAARPMTDPNADAERYLHQGSGSGAPSIPGASGY
jgi:hypothetical protein